MLRRARAADDREVRRGRSRDGRAAGGGRAARGRRRRRSRTAAADGRLARRVARGDEGRSPRPAYDVQSDGRVYERFGEEPTPFYLFGAGHVGRALAWRWRRCRSPSPGSTRGRARFPAHVPGQRHRHRARRPGATLLARAPDGAFVAGHDPQPRARPRSGRSRRCRRDRFPYVGLIGSATKRARFTSAMPRWAWRPNAIDKLVCPIGLTAIRDKAPAAIAASVAAQVLMVREQLKRCGSRLADHVRSGRAMADTADRAGSRTGKPDPCRTRCRCSRRSASPSSMATSSPTTTSTSRSGRPRSMRCSARTAPASRRW